MFSRHTQHRNVSVGLNIGTFERAEAKDCVSSSPIHHRTRGWMADSDATCCASMS